MAAVTPAAAIRQEQDVIKPVEKANVEIARSQPYKPRAGVPLQAPVVAGVSVTPDTVPVVVMAGGRSDPLRTGTPAAAFPVLPVQDVSIAQAAIDQYKWQKMADDAMGKRSSYWA